MRFLLKTEDFEHGTKKGMIFRQQLVANLARSVPNLFFVIFFLLLFQFPNRAFKDLHVFTGKQFFQLFLVRQRVT